MIMLSDIANNHDIREDVAETDRQPADKTWRAFYTRPRHERKAAARLEEAGIEVYCPTVRVKVRWSDRWKKVTKVLFTSYVFARVNEKERITVLEDESISRCVLYLGKPALIRDNEIEAIRLLLDAGTNITIHRLKPGTKVRITDGPLEGRIGELITYNNAQQAILRIEALGTEIQATLTPEQVQAFQT